VIVRTPRFATGRSGELALVVVVGVVVVEWEEEPHAATLNESAAATPTRANRRNRTESLSQDDGTAT
jgi:hypothetical protein